MFGLRRAQPEEAALCYRFICDARAFQRAQGFVQWTDDRPNLATVERDIAGKCGFLFENDGMPVGYCFIADGPDKTYAVIDGQWKTDRPYMVVHRVAFSKDAAGKGLSRGFFEEVRTYIASCGCRAIRIDTHRENLRMQHILEREGFARCGIVWMEDGTDRIAYELDL